ncbi:Arginine transport ATP-binding protein ArtP [Peptoniphilus harei]|uniref:Arginine transport ATP-binding protein ArtP n=1 Tax=Peptoniphilus harei TaxID=54005 RepID=A0A2X1X0G6_9FIRM|nr:ATP-binding cassette domain-containing protein [Peptoniphilus harei]SPY36262.1 Arginine transport ATP-binding protein ArtP [Peptoniphilus harei]
MLYGYARCNSSVFSESVRDEFSLFDSKIDEKQIDNILEKLDLKKLDNRHPMCLSGGQMQRLSVALGMLMNREIIILDEPTSGLDYTNMLEISKVIKEFSNNKLYYVTHDNELIDSTCNKLLKFAMAE